MGRQYAGVLGLIAFCVGITRGVIHDSSAESTIVNATLGMFLFAAIGWIVGKIAESTVLQSVRTQANEELDAYERQLSEETTS